LVLLFSWKTIGDATGATQETPWLAGAVRIGRFVRSVCRILFVLVDYLFRHSHPVVPMRVYII